MVNSLQLLTAKPVTYLVNLSERDFIRKKNKWLPKIKGWIDEHNPGDLLIPFSVALEERLGQLSAEEKAEEEKNIGATSALPRITHAGYNSLHLIRYFTCGPDEVRAWTIRKGTKAPQAAGVIHSDFENKFVCGEIMSYDDLKEYGSEASVKAAGKLRQQGKPYESESQASILPLRALTDSQWSMATLRTGRLVVKVLHLRLSCKPSRSPVPLHYSIQNPPRPL